MGILPTFFSFEQSLSGDAGKAKPGAAGGRQQKNVSFPSRRQAFSCLS
jgi:hypothetical protein